MSLLIHCIIVNDLLDIRRHGKPFKRQHHSTNRKYDVLSSGDVHKVVRKRTHKEVVHEGELFDIIDKLHTGQGHCGRDKTMALVAEKFDNIPRKLIALYLATCRTCEEKRARPSASAVSHPIVENDVARRAQIDLIDWHSERQNGFSYILNYQDHLSKFIILRPLKTKSAEEVAYHLVDIFCLVGAPNVIQVTSQS